MAAHPGDDASKAGGWSTGVHAPHAITERQGYADRMEALLREAKLNQGAKIGIKELVEKTDNPSARPTDLRPSSALTVQAFISLGAAPEDLLQKTERDFAHLELSIAAIHLDHARQERQELIDKLVERRAKIEAAESRARRKTNLAQISDAELKEKNVRLVAVMEKKLMSEVEELQQREQRALQSQSHLDERRMHAMERMESTRKSMGAAKHRDVMRSMNRHGARTKQKAMMAENEVARTNDLEEMAEMRRLAREEQRREHAAQRRAQWEERRQRALQKMQQDEASRMAKLEMREKNLEERGQKRLTTLVQSMAERSKETETALKNARERHARHWEERKERILREHEEKVRKEEEAYERYAGELESKLTTVTQFNRTRKWDPESVQAQRDTWVARLEERERRREEQVRERAARLEETTQVRQAFRTLTASKILKTARRQERADEVDRMERRRELDEDVLEYLKLKEERQKGLNRRQHVNAKANIERWKKREELEREKLRLMHQNNPQRLAGVNISDPITY